MKCGEFVEKFSDFRDAQGHTSVRKAGEEHLLKCEKCKHYYKVFSEGVLILKEAPLVKLPENFWAGLEHRIFHLRDEKMLKDPLFSPTRTIAVACSFILLLFFISDLLMSNDRRDDIELPAIIVSGDPANLPSRIMSGSQQRSSDMFVYQFWSDINNLMYEYSTMSERYRIPPVLRQTDFVEYK